MARRKKEAPLSVPNPRAGGSYLFDAETGELKLMQETLPSSGALKDGQALSQEDDPGQD
jgi:hypothetical protein